MQKILLLTKGDVLRWRQRGGGARTSDTSFLFPQKISVIGSCHLPLPCFGPGDCRGGVVISLDEGPVLSWIRNDLIPFSWLPLESGCRNCWRFSGGAPTGRTQDTVERGALCFSTVSKQILCIKMLEVTARPKMSGENK